MPEREQELTALGRAVHQIREERGMTAADLAAAGIDGDRLDAIEAGCLDPGYRRLRRLAVALGITSTALLRRVEEHDAAPAGGEHDESREDPRAVSAAFGRRLRELRAERGLSQDDLARRTGLHATAIGRYEHGAREPRLTAILRLAHGLGVKPRELVEDPDAAEGEA
jgi:transcriptional regulator with XRE-family HTH domain